MTIDLRHSEQEQACQGSTQRSPRRACGEAVPFQEGVKHAFRPRHTHAGGKRTLPTQMDQRAKILGSQARQPPRVGAIVVNSGGQGGGDLIVHVQNQYRLATANSRLAVERERAGPQRRHLKSRQAAGADRSQMVATRDHALREVQNREQTARPGRAGFRAAHPSETKHEAVETLLPSANVAVRLGRHA